MLIVVALGAWWAIWSIQRAVRNAPLDQDPELSQLDRWDGQIPCPPSHGAHCRCTWQ